jgi:O-antigen/teichoic acid export membrane protein
VWGTVLSTLASVLAPILVVRLLGKHDVATLLTLFLVYDTFVLLLVTGFPQTLMFYISARPLAERRAIALRAFKTVAALGLAAGAALGLVGLFGDTVLQRVSHGSDKPSLGPLLVFAVLPVFDLPSRLLPNLLVVEHRTPSVAKIGVLRALTDSLSVVVPVALGYGVWTVVTCLVTVSAVRGGLLVGGYLKRLYGAVAVVPSPVGYRQLFRFAIPLGATDIIARLNTLFDRYLILFCFPGASFATYAAGAQPVPVIPDIPYQVGTAYAPDLVRLFSEGKPRQALALWQQTITKVSLLVLPVMGLCIVAADEVVRLVFTPAYSDATPIFRLYSILALGRVAAYGTVIVAAGKPRYVLRAAVLSFASNVLFSVPLVMILGYIGPALGTLLAFVPTLIFYCWCIALSAGVRLAEVFPIASYLRVAAVVAVAAIPAVWFKFHFALSSGKMLAGEAVLLLGTYALVGGATRTIAGEDWRFVGNWLRLKLAR